jgi:microsomal dipeptidase-like Zn-dependent dipeptidase
MSERVSRLHAEAPLTDIHVHPSLKAWLFGRNLWRHYWSGPAFDPFSSRSDFKSLKAGAVGVIWATHYLPERGLLDDCLLLRVAALALVPRYCKKFKGPQFERLLAMMDVLEREIARHPDRAELARSAADVRRIRAAGKIAVVHALEGAHPLVESSGDLERNLERLAGRGLAMIALCHFYANGLAGHVDGIPRTMAIRKLCRFDLGVGTGPPLSELGRRLLAKLRALPMLVDVSHCSPRARSAIFAELGTDRPVVASHVGAQAFNPDPYNLADDEIAHVARTGGVVGVIFMSYWLDEHHPAAGLPAIWATLEHVRRVTGSWDHVALGTDFDGFTDPPNDVKDSAELPRVTEMLLERGVAEDDVRKILGGNAQRVLEAGWR